MVITLFAVAPLCYIYNEPVNLYYVFREMYMSHFFRLHTLSSHPQVSYWSARWEKQTKQKQVVNNKIVWSRMMSAARYLHLKADHFLLLDSGSKQVKCQPFHYMWTIGPTGNWDPLRGCWSDGPMFSVNIQTALCWIVASYVVCSHIYNTAPCALLYDVLHHLVVTGWSGIWKSM